MLLHILLDQSKKPFSGVPPCWSPHFGVLRSLWILVISPLWSPAQGCHEVQDFLFPDSASAPRVALFRLPSFQALGASPSPCHPCHPFHPFVPALLHLCAPLPLQAARGPPTPVSPLSTFPTPVVPHYTPLALPGIPRTDVPPSQYWVISTWTPTMSPQGAFEAHLWSPASSKHTPTPPTKPPREMQRYLGVDSGICKIQTPLQKNPCQRPPSIFGVNSPSLVT